MVANRSSLALFVYCSWLRLSLALRLIHCQSFAQHFSGRIFFPLPTNTKYKIGWHKTQNEPGNMINSLSQFWQSILLLLAQEPKGAKLNFIEINFLSQIIQNLEVRNRRFILFRKVIRINNYFEVAFLLRWRL